jgi:flagellar export protein FliJ
MGFRFPLATVLRLREIAEDREERLLAQILRQIAHTRQDLEDLGAERAQLVRTREGELQQRMAAADLHLSNAQIVAIEERQKVALELMNKLETLRSQQVKVYEATHRNRELLAGMRAQQREWFHTEQSRQEQRIQDDNFAARKSLR